jgi:formylglycine-generating enzyme required for sulfatase activity
MKKDTSECLVNNKSLIGIKIIPVGLVILKKICFIRTWNIKVANCNSPAGCDNHPVEQVNWDDIKEFFVKLNKKELV